ncbi:MAG: hypothetical protein WAW75_07900 [Gallionella sp.]
MTDEYVKQVKAFEDDLDWEATNPPKLTREQAQLLDAMQQAPRAVSMEADFDAMTWTFQIKNGCRVGCGTYALVWVPNVKLTSGAAAESETKK